MRARKIGFLGRISIGFCPSSYDRSGVSDLSVRAHDSQFMIFGSSRSVILLSFCHRFVIVGPSLSSCHCRSVMTFVSFLFCLPGSLGSGKILPISRVCSTSALRAI